MDSSENETTQCLPIEDTTVHSSSDRVMLHTDTSETTKIVYSSGD